MSEITHYSLKPAKFGFNWAFTAVPQCGW